MSALFHRFNRYLAAGITAAALVAPAFALDTVKFMAPGSVGGGYDQTARVLGKALIEAKAAKSTTFETRAEQGDPGAGAIRQQHKRRPECAAGRGRDHGDGH